ncbi:MULTISPECIES: hypothetical protein [Glaesserella]|uniref:Type II secretory pathway, component PulJ n=1 Tax=Glaesserella australis TaxID=2094024 RepID=A0A328BX16_9PAST|nr:MULTISPECIES: hypothetical protein [Glaesserella]AUI66592.1 hypothetical protein CJD39_08410 [Glaesserella sp. 15-184]RAL18766.1 hypothetical protein C5N92_06435 [Glaesserella australis]
MLFKRENGQPVKIYKAFSFIEILLALTLGSIILFAFATFYSDIYRNQIKQRELLNLQKHTHQLLDYFQQHIQHINYQGENRKESNYSIFADNHHNYALNNPHCLMFFYDLSGDGCVGNRNKTQACENNGVNKTKDVSQEFFGFKFEKKAIFIYEDSQIQYCAEPLCKQLLTNCQAGNWRKMSDMSDYNVENLQFEWLEQDKLLKIALALSSTKNNKIQYQATAYSYILNSRDK